MNRRYLTAGGIFLLAFILRLRGATQISFWFDELWTAAHWTHPHSLLEVWDKLWVPVEGNLPLYPLFINLWSWPFGTSELSLIFPSILFGAASVSVLFLLAEKLYGYKEGIFAGVLMATLSTPLYFAQEARGYSLILFLVTLNLYSKYSEKKMAWSITGFLLCWVHYVGIFFILTQFAYDLFKKNDRIKWYLIPFAGLLPLLPLILHQMQNGPTFPPMKHPPEFWNWVFDSHFEFLTFCFVLMFSLQTIISLFSKKNGRRELILYVYVPYLFLLGVCLLIKPAYSKRYFITLVPPALLILTALIKKAGDKFPKATSILSSILLVTSLVSALKIDIRKNEKNPRLKEALEFIDRVQDHDKTLFIKEQDQAVWQYYLKDYKNIKSTSRIQDEKVIWFIDLSNSKSEIPNINLLNYHVLDYHDLGLTRVFKLIHENAPSSSP